MTRRTAGATALAAGVAIWLAACATPYQPVGFMGGYSELPSSGETVLVAFRWTRFTPRERIADFLLLRAAEVALDRGAPYFVVLEQPAGLQTDLLRGTLAVRPAARPSAEREGARPSGEEMLNADPRSAEIRIQLVKEKPPSGPPCLDAAKLRTDLRAKYGLGT